MHSLSDVLLTSLSTMMNNLAEDRCFNSSSFSKNDNLSSFKHVAEQQISSSQILVTENELVANDIVHDYHHFLSVTTNAHTEAENSLKVDTCKYFIFLPNM